MLHFETWSLKYFLNNLNCHVAQNKLLQTRILFKFIFNNYSYLFYSCYTLLARKTNHLNKIPIQI